MANSIAADPAPATLEEYLAERHMLVERLRTAISSRDERPFDEAADQLNRYAAAVMLGKYAAAPDIGLPWRVAFAHLYPALIDRYDPNSSVRQRRSFKELLRLSLVLV